jgi:hypothetical protein
MKWDQYMAHAETGDTKVKVNVPQDLDSDLNATHICGDKPEVMTVSETPESRRRTRLEW